MDPLQQHSWAGRLDEADRLKRLRKSVHTACVSQRRDSQHGVIVTQVVTLQLFRGTWENVKMNLKKTLQNSSTH